MPEPLHDRPVIEFDYPAPDADVPWQIEDLGGGVVARYRRTIARRSRVITGTGGYREGVDFHTEIHCSACCCTPSEVDGCRQPAGGFVVIGGRSGCASVWQIAIATLAALHLQDPIRHVKPTRCASDECPRKDDEIAIGGNAR
jgi:hypothetical protein